MECLKECTNMFGDQMSPALQKRIKKFTSNPNPDTWDDIHGIVVNGTNTVWQAVLMIDQTFPHRGRTEDEKGNVLKEWERIPTPFQVLHAIKCAVNK